MTEGRFFIYSVLPTPACKVLLDRALKNVTRFHQYFFDTEQMD